MEITNNNQKGMTLVEVLLYVAISSIIMTSLSYFMITTSRSRVKAQTITEVEYQGDHSLRLIDEVIRNSINITTPAIDTSGSVLTIETNDPSTNPTSIYLEDEQIYLKEGSSDPVMITSSKIKTLSLVFTNVSIVESLPLLRTEISITHINPENRMEYNYSENFNLTSSIRK